jgi:CRP-like cAMP-binding protein/anti-anti-sigma regulatory factor
MVIAVQDIDPWSIDLVRRIRIRAPRDRWPMLLDLAVIAIVAVLAVTVDIVLAVFLGILIAVVLFVVRMSRSNIRRLYRCDMIHSRKARTPAQANLLEHLGGKILVIELEGVLFFGSAEKLSEEITCEARPETHTVILDLRRVTEIDATGSQILADIRQSLMHKHQHMALAVANGSALATRLSATGIVDAVGEDGVFADVDRAIEWAEDDLLRDDDDDGGELGLSDVDLCAGLTAAEIAQLQAYMVRTSYPAGSVIFREGDPGKALFVLTKGHASACLAQPAGSDIRLVTFAPGTVFGELAILDGGPRSATVCADDAVDCYLLSREKFGSLETDAPAVAIKLLANLGAELSTRLRKANRTIHQLEI